MRLFLVGIALLISISTFANEVNLLLVIKKACTEVSHSPARKLGCLEKGIDSYANGLNYLEVSLVVCPGFGVHAGSQGDCFATFINELSSDEIKEKTNHCLKEGSWAAKRGKCFKEEIQKLLGFDYELVQ